MMDVVFPPVCAGCGRLGTILCDSCIASLVPMDTEICPRCGRALTGQKATPRKACAACFSDPPLLQQARAPFLYVEPLSRLIHRLKYDRYFALAKPLALLMAGLWPMWEQTPDLILPVPLHARRQRQRGFNQSALLGKYLAQELRLDFQEKSLRRHRHTEPQIKLGPDERRRNVAGAFEADSARVADRHIVLIDDVYTTGATMDAAAEALLAARALSVSGFCLARVR